jgi:hypothetical protein
LQSFDADICARVQRSLRKDGVPALSVHDSFIVPISHEAKLQNVMEEETVSMCDALAQRRRSK